MRLRLFCSQTRVIEIQLVSIFDALCVLRQSDILLYVGAESFVHSRF